MQINDRMKIGGRGGYGVFKDKNFGTQLLNGFLEWQYMMTRKVGKANSFLEGGVALPLETTS